MAEDLDLYLGVFNNAIFVQNWHKVTTEIRNIMRKDIACSFRETNSKINLLSSKNPYS